MFSFSSPLHSTSQREPLEYLSQTPGRLRPSYFENDHYSHAASSPLNQHSFHRSINDNDSSFACERPFESLLSSISPFQGFNQTVAEQSTSPGKMKKIPFAFETCARNSSPSVKLGNFVKANREKRKNGFLQGIKGRRQGREDERLDEQILRTDYIQSIKAWEQQIAMEDVREDIQPEDENVDMVDEDPGLMEEQLIEALVSYQEGEPDASDSYSDDEYDDIFMELSNGHTDMDQGL